MAQPPRHCTVLLCLFIHGFIVWSEAQVPGRTRCGPEDDWPEGRINSTGRLAAFRSAMGGIQLGDRTMAAFIVGTEDAHWSEYPTDHDQRRAYMTGFTGSAGIAVVTRDKAALWTDGRYFLEADDVMDCNWILMKKKVKGTPSIVEWLDSEMTVTGEIVGVDETLETHDSFKRMSKKLEVLPKQTVLHSIPNSRNPVDIAWTTDRPPQPANPINALHLKFAGETWQNKLKFVRGKLASQRAFVVTSLDETAWLFNLRGTDVKYNPFFLSYTIVEQDAVTLYILDKDRRLTASPTDPATDVTLATHLGTSSRGVCEDPSADCVQVKDYNQTVFEADLRRLSSQGKIWITHLANHAIYQTVQENCIVKNSPIALEKSIKNPTERAGMKRAYDRDSAGLIKFLSFLELEIEAGNSWTEISAAVEMDKRRSELQDNRGISFSTISCYGSNGALIHYRPNNFTNKVISNDGLYLLDSGGQYLDGTTDVTRTMHYGTPTDYEKECYTLVLKSAISLATLKWPAGLYGNQIDPFARHILWDSGLDYLHGTGGGIGAYLSVHEGPSTIYQASAPKSSEEPLLAHQFYSDEPGYYEDGKFGIRLETIMMIRPYTPKYNTSGADFLEFLPITLVPFEPKLIDLSRLTDKEISWLNDYNQRILDEILPMLEGDDTAINWVRARTQRIGTDTDSTVTDSNPTSTAQPATVTVKVMVPVPQNCSGNGGATLLLLPSNLIAASMLLFVCSHVSFLFGNH